MPKISSFYAKQAPLDVEIGDETIHMTIRPAVYTEAYEEELIAASKASPSPTGADDQNKLLCDLVVEWDLEDDEGVIPLTRDALKARVPFGLAREINAQILKAITRVGEATRSARR